MTKTNTKRGFNLIEIAIVLAVIGLVIGGIYVAASAVTENNRRQVTQKELLQIVQNVRTTFATQTALGTLSYAQLKALSIMPGELTDNGSTGYVNSYNGAVTLAQNGSNATQFDVTFAGLSQGACTDMLAKPFGTTASVNQIGLMSATVNGAAIATTSGITAATAATNCSVTGNGNTATLTFNLH